MKILTTFAVAFFFQNCSMNSSLNNKSYAQYEGIANTITLSSTKDAYKAENPLN